jgi:hypothetical protein
MFQMAEARGALKSVDGFLVLPRHIVGVTQKLNPALGLGGVQQQYFFDPADRCGRIAELNQHFSALRNDTWIVRVERIGTILMKAHLVVIPVQ